MISRYASDEFRQRKDAVAFQTPGVAERLAEIPWGVGLTAAVTVPPISSIPYRPGTMDKMSKIKKDAAGAPTNVNDNVAQDAQAVNAEIVAQMVAYEVTDYLDAEHATAYREAERKIEFAYKADSLSDMVAMMPVLNAIEAVAVNAFVQQWAEYRAELIAAFRVIARDLLIGRRELVVWSLDDCSLDAVRRIDDENKAAGYVDYMQSQSYAGMSERARFVLSVFSDAVLSELVERGDYLLRGGTTHPVLGAMDAAFGADRARDIRRDVAAELVADKWTIVSNESVFDDTDDIPLLTRPKRQTYFAIPSPHSTFTMPNQVHGALTGLSERGRTARMLARDRVIELEEGAGCKTIVAVSDGWCPVEPEDVWPRLRLISMLDAARMKYGPDILPLSVPVDVGCRWAFGSCGGGDTDARAQREEQLRAFLARQRESVRIDFGALAKSGRIDADRVASELGVSVSRFGGVYEGPLFNTEYWEWAQVNRNGEAGKCFRVLSWPTDYLFSVAIGYAQRIPDSLTELLEPGTRRVYEGPGMLAVKSYLLTRIVEMYRNPKLQRVIVLDGLYTWIGAIDPQSRRRVRERCVRYLESWAIPRVVHDPVKRRPFIKSWELVPKDARTPTGYKVSLVRGGLGRLLSV